MAECARVFVPGGSFLLVQYLQVGDCNITDFYFSPLISYYESEISEVKKRKKIIQKYLKSAKAIA
jgi:hypothetical protein